MGFILCLSPLSKGKDPKDRKIAELAAENHNLMDRLDEAMHRIHDLEANGGDMGGNGGHGHGAMHPEDVEEMLQLREQNEQLHGEVAAARAEGGAARAEQARAAREVVSVRAEAEAAADRAVRGLQSRFDAFRRESAMEVARSRESTKSMAEVKRERWIVCHS